jgi:hypothetical protein
MPCGCHGYLWLFTVAVYCSVSPTPPYSVAEETKRKVKLCGAPLTCKKPKTRHRPSPLQSASGFPAAADVSWHLLSSIVPSRAFNLNVTSTPHDSRSPRRTRRGWSQVPGKIAGGWAGFGGISGTHQRVNTPESVTVPGSHIRNRNDLERVRKQPRKTSDP